MIKLILLILLGALIGLILGLLPHIKKINQKAILLNEDGDDIHNHPDNEILFFDDPLSVDTRNLQHPDNWDSNDKD